MRYWIFLIILFLALPLTQVRAEDDGGDNGTITQPDPPPTPQIDQPDQTPPMPPPPMPEPQGD